MARIFNPITALNPTFSPTFKGLAPYVLRYRSRYGDRAPTLNSIGQSLYEGMHFLAMLLDDSAHASGAAGVGQAPLPYASARAASYAGAGANRAPIYLACAEGHSFRVLARF